MVAEAMAMAGALVRTSLASVAELRGLIFQPVRRDARQQVWPFTWSDQETFWVWLNRLFNRGAHSRLGSEVVARA